MLIKIILKSYFKCCLTALFLYNIPGHTATKNVQLVPNNRQVSQVAKISVGQISQAYAHISLLACIRTRSCVFTKTTPN